MALWDYMQKRMQELGLTAYKLQKDYDVPWSTIQRIKAGKPITTPSKQKLALALQCSIGDLNAAAIAKPVVPEQDEAEKESEGSVMATIDELEKMVKEDFPDGVPVKPKARKAKNKKTAEPEVTVPQIAEEEEIKEASPIVGVLSEASGESPGEEATIVMRDTQKILHYHFDTTKPGECEITVSISTLMPAKHILQVLEAAVDLIGQELRDTQQKEA